MRALGLMICIALFGDFASASVLTFKEWKARRVMETQSLIAQVKLQREATESSRKRLIHANIQLQAARELTPNDYFHLYVIGSVGNDPEKVKGIVKRLSKEELSEILGGYIDQTKKINRSSKSLDLRVISLQSSL